MEAIRAGANNHDATEYANAKSIDRPNFIPINVEVPIAPKGYGKPGEVEQLLPKGWLKGHEPPVDAADMKLTSTNPDMESVKRPMTEEEPAPQQAVSATVEKPIVNETPKPVQEELPEGWNTKDFTWPSLRALCIKVAMKTPHNRTNAVSLILKATGGG